VWGVWGVCSLFGSTTSAPGPSPQESLIIAHMSIYGNNHSWSLTTGESLGPGGFWDEIDPVEETFTLWTLTGGTRYKASYLIIAHMSIYGNNRPYMVIIINHMAWL